MQKRIIDCSTGEVEQRPLTADELAQYELDQAAVAAAEAAPTPPTDAEKIAELVEAVTFLTNVVLGG